MEVMRFHQLFEACGVKPGDKVAICGANGCRWAVAFLAVATYRAVAVALPYDWNSESVDELLVQSGCRLLFTDEDKLASLHTELMPELQAVVIMDDGTCLWSRGACPQVDIDPRFFGREDFSFSLGAPEDTAMILYGSEGLAFSNACLSTDIEKAMENAPSRDGDRAFVNSSLSKPSGLISEFLYSFFNGSMVCFR